MRFFTSGLSVNEFALLGKMGPQPLAQVMGASVIRVGWQYLPALAPGGDRRAVGGVALELVDRAVVDPDAFRRIDREVDYPEQAVDVGGRRRERRYWASLTLLVGMVIAVARSPRRSWRAA